MAQGRTNRIALGREGRKRRQCQLECSAVAAVMIVSEEEMTGRSMMSIVDTTKMFHTDLNCPEPGAIQLDHLAGRSPRPDGAQMMLTVQVIRPVFVRT